MTPEFSRRLGAALGRARFDLLGSVEATFEMEDGIRDWATNNPDASWETMPADMREYVELVEGPS